MSLSSLHVPPAPADEPAAAYRIIAGDEPDLLARIEESSIGLVLWHRQLPEALAAWLARLPPRRLPTGRIRVRLDDLASALADLFIASRTPQGEMSDALAADIMDLSTRFARLAGGGIVDLRLEVVRHDACWKFHRDSVRLRLLTTYLGAATQIVPAHDAERALRQQRDYQGPFCKIPDHAAALFKGTRNEPGAGVVHRSPPIAGTGNYRFILCVNQPSTSSPELWKRSPTCHPFGTLE